MTAVLIHPTGVRPRGANLPRRNWARTIERTVDLRRDAAAGALTPHERDALLRHHPDGTAVFWGAKATHAATMRRVRPGDVVLLSGDSRVLAIGRVGVVLEAPAFGDALWPEPGADGYAHVYSIDALTFPEGLTYEEVMRRCATRAISFRGLNLRQGTRAQVILEGLAAEIPGQLGDPEASGRVDLSPRGARGLTRDPADDDDAAFPPAQRDLLARLEAMGSTDAAGAVRVVRRERTLLRDSLGIGQAAGDAVAQCELCGRDLPRRLLVAAHVKPRSECTEEERRDIEHVAMRACLLGCDALYEAGFLTVDATGRIVIARGEAGDTPLGTVLRGLAGHRAPAWTPQREPYFEWHRANKFRERVVADAMG